jgi:hypothetical protein
VPNPLTTYIQEAAAIVQDAGISTESYAGGVALDYVLKAQFSATPRETTPQPSLVEPGVDNRLNRLAEWSELDAEQLRDAFDVGVDEIAVVVSHRHLAIRKSERQRQLVLLKLAAERIANDRQTVPAREVNALCEEYDCMDQNLPRNVQEGGMIIRRGSRGAYDYRVTREGIDAASELLKRFLGAP